MANQKEGEVKPPRNLYEQLTELGINAESMGMVGAGFFNANHDKNTGRGTGMFAHTPITQIVYLLKSSLDFPDDWNGKKLTSTQRAHLAAARELAEGQEVSSFNAGRHLAIGRLIVENEAVRKYLQDALRRKQIGLKSY